MLTPCRHGISGKMIIPSRCGVGGSTPLTGMQGMVLISCAYMLTWDGIPYRIVPVGSRTHDSRAWCYMPVRGATTNAATAWCYHFARYTMSAGCIALYAYTLQTWYIWHIHTHTNTHTHTHTHTYTHTYTHATSSNTHTHTRTYTYTYIQRCSMGDPGTL
jgi:hypothetical protein